jgi:putative ABC transport system permease protein
VLLLIRLAIALFPRAFRREFAASMYDMAAEEISRAAVRGRRAAWWCALGAALNLIGTAAAERLHPTWNAPSVNRFTRGEWTMPSIERWLRDLRLAARSLSRTPGFAAITALTLALAIGANAAIFAAVNAVVISPLPFAHVDRLMYVTAAAPGSEFSGEFGLPLESLFQIRDRATRVENFAFFQSFTGTVRIGDRVERLQLSQPTYTLFATLGAAPVLGRLPGPEDDMRTAMLSYRIWQDWLGGATDVIGKSYVVDGEPREIIGVLGPEFRFPNANVAAWIPTEARLDRIDLGQPGDGAVARVKAGVSAESLERELTDLVQQLPVRFGTSSAYDRLLPRLHVVARPLKTEIVGAAARSLGILFAATLIVLVIACANVSSLFAVRAESRRHELAIRQAIGAQRGQLVRAQLCEVIVIALAAALLAVALASVALPVFLALAPGNVPRLSSAAIDVSTIVFTFVLALAAGLACGLAPALRSSRARALDMRGTTRSVTGQRRWERDALLVGQTALAIVLLVGAGLLMRSYSRLSHVAPGYSTKDLYTFQFAPDQPQLADGPSWARFHLDFMDRLRALPGVQAVGVVDNVPLDEGTYGARFAADGAAVDSGVRLSFTFAGPDYYSTIGIKLLAGRPFTRDDATGMRGNVVVSKSAARLLWPNVDPIGRRVTNDRTRTWDTVIGVVDDVIQQNWRQPAQPLVYYPLTGQTPQQWRVTSPAYVVRTSRADTIGSDVRALIRQVAPEAPMYRAYTMQFLAGRQMRELSFTMLTLGLVSALAIALAAVGLYGALSYVVAQRTREIGVRLALGAQPGTVRRMVVREGGQIIGVGVVAGTVIALIAAPMLGRLLFDVAPIDPATFGAVVTSMVLVGLLASYLPARRASNVDPIVSLRGE